MAFIPSACPSYEGRTHSWDRTDIVPRFRWITYLLYCIKGPLTEHREWMTSHADLPTFLWFEFSPHYFTEKSHQKVLILTHPMAPAELKFRSWVSSPLPPSRPSVLHPTISIFQISSSTWWNCVYSHSLSARKGKSWDKSYPWWSLVTLAKLSWTEWEGIKSSDKELKPFSSFRTLKPVG